ncbi:hypothetical protein Nepgr_002160 [Nepenthes gracilis]|uniref:Uncharacterized protein n=1 Tax=Nepenthes gracilis TaxID=150966 RepID=A0AAD3RY38_NEPGR|nr:hypothetical protein Nepgr_002160 [Nepenthes gracilis]
MSCKTATLLIAFLCLVQVDQLEMCEGQQPTTVEEKIGIDCEAKCEHRCSKASRQKICMRACITCCQRCSCVPPGTAGNYDACPCYANITTHGGRKKCP